MASLLVSKQNLSGQITIPPSKSQTLRAILFASLVKGESLVSNYLNSPDAEAMINACRLLGATVHCKKNVLEIKGINFTIGPSEDVIDAGNSGLVLRFISAVGALGSHPIVITGDYSIRHQRPMQDLLDGLSQLGAKAVSTKGDGYAPVIIQGPLLGGRALIRGEDSQPVSALLIAASLAKEPIELEVINPGEQPWVELTLDWLDRLGLSIENHQFKHFYIKGGGVYSGFSYHVPGDYSSAAFPMAAALITQSELELKHLDPKELQGDKKLISILQAMGAEIEVGVRGLKLKKSRKLRGIEMDINSCIDVITILAVIACFAEGEMRLYNAQVARHKECDRIRSTVQELKKMGADITELDDGLLIRQSELKGAEVFSHHDHRMALSLAVAGLAASGKTLIRSFQCVKKTYPSFVEDFNHLGANFILMPEED